MRLGCTTIPLEWSNREWWNKKVNSKQDPFCVVFYIHFLHYWGAINAVYCATNCQMRLKQLIGPKEMKDHNNTIHHNTDTTHEKLQQVHWAIVEQPPYSFNLYHATIICLDILRKCWRGGIFLMTKRWKNLCANDFRHAPKFFMKME